MKGAEGRLVEDLVEGVDEDGRRIYRSSAKRTLVERALLPGVSVSRLALDHGVNANLLRKWIRAHAGAGIRSARQAESSSSPSPAMLPVVVTAAADHPVRATPVTPASIEIVVGGASVHVRGAADVQVLRTVLDCLMAQR